MSLIRRGVESRAVAGTFGLTYNPLNLLYGQTSLMSSANERVDEVTALGVSSVLSAVSLLADSVATMPLIATQTDRNGVRTPTKMPSVLANPDPGITTSFEFIHTVMASMLLHGNAYVFIIRDSRGEPIGLTPFHPYQMNVMPNKDATGRKYLHLGKEIDPRNMLHIRNMTPAQGLVGVSPLLQQRTVFGLALAMDRYLAQWYGEGATPSGVLESDRPVTTEQARLLRETWENTHRKHRRPAVLSDGLKWRPVTSSAVDMDFVKTREAVITEVARVFRIPAHLMLLRIDNQTYSNVEQASLNFLTYTLQPWLRRLEIAFSEILPEGVDVHFDASSLLRLDASTRARVEMMQIQTGTRSANELRISDGLEPYNGGDKFIQVLPGAPVDPLVATTGMDSNTDVVPSQVELDR